MLAWHKVLADISDYRQMLKLHGKQVQEVAVRRRPENPISSRPILIYFEFRGKPSLITVICVDPHSHNKILFPHTRRSYSFFFFIYLFFVFMMCYVILFSLLLLIFTKIIQIIIFIIIILFIDFSYKYYVNFSWTWMFRKIPEYSVFLVLSTPEYLLATHRITTCCHVLYNVVSLLSMERASIKAVLTRTFNAPPANDKFRIPLYGWRNGAKFTNPIFIRI